MFTLFAVFLLYCFKIELVAVEKRQNFPLCRKVGKIGAKSASHKGVLLKIHSKRVPLKKLGEDFLGRFRSLAYLGNIIKDLVYLFYIVVGKGRYIVGYGSIPLTAPQTSRIRPMPPPKGEASRASCC